MASVINIGFSLIALILFTLSTAVFAQAIALPEGNTGIAASFPGDVNIQFSPDVLFADNFESYTSESQLTSPSQWSSGYHGENIRIATEQANVFSGSRAVEFTLPQTSTEVANALVKDLSQPQDTLFVRVYTKFDSGFDVASPGHNGIRISAGNYPGPGNIPNGTDFFLFSLENSNWYNEAEPGYTHVYVYHPEQRSVWGDHWYPNGNVLPYDSQPGNFGPNFVPRSNFIPQKDRWYSYELMVKANTPGQRDGRAAIWIDGVLMADFQNLRLRDVSTLKINQIQLELHSPDSSLRVNKKWYDNVVVARSYIGPATVQIEATKVIQDIHSLQQDVIATMAPSAFKNANMQNTLLNMLNAVITNIETGAYSDALGQLQNDILGKTDGCAASGTPDQNDWILSCADQNQVYPPLLNIITEVKALCQ